MTRVYYSIALTFTGTPVHFLFIHFFSQFSRATKFLHVLARNARSTIIT